VRLLMPYAEGSPRPPSAPIDQVGIDESIAAKSPGFSFLGMIFDQDMSNMPLVQKGVKAADPAHHHTVLGTFQESLIQYWHQLYDQRMAR